ncbi:ATP-dependent DNA helicase PIF1-like [Limulus polyphemus]|uniref:ATP-dependent DNA helicase PIF1-like n=1 Tax=Limulus polyphemus TaxID=6850 RepID=A0ABM1S841_LIMPO|nr:ATP-dependent DNA helicase PIF1-like [Limulus polyphemus]
MPLHRLLLKVGAIVMLRRNLNPKKRLNGARLLIMSLYQYFLDCEILNGSHKTEIVFISKIDLAPNETSLPFVLKRRQLPVIIAFVITIHKSQGQILYQVGVFLPEPMSGHGQLYVAITITRDENNFKIFVTDRENQGSDE